MPANLSLWLHVALVCAASAIKLDRAGAGELNGLDASTLRLVEEEVARRMKQEEEKGGLPQEDLSEQECHYRSESWPCYYWSSPDESNRDPTDGHHFVAEYSFDPDHEWKKTGGNLHDIALGPKIPDDTNHEAKGQWISLIITQQNAGKLIWVTFDSERPVITLEHQVHNLHNNQNPDEAVRWDSGAYGPHQVIMSHLHSDRMYVTLEFRESVGGIGVYHTQVRKLENGPTRWELTLTEKGFVQVPENVASEHCAKSDGDNPPPGLCGVHTLVEDKYGNVLFTMKFAGRVGRMKVEGDNYNIDSFAEFRREETEHINKPPLPFYIKTNEARDTIWANSIMTSAVIAINVDRFDNEVQSQNGEQHPHGLHVKCAAPRPETKHSCTEFELSLDPTRTDLMAGVKTKHLRPGGIAVLTNGNALVVAYNAIGTVASIDLETNAIRYIKVSDDQAFLHIALQCSDGQQQRKCNVWLAGSSNDFGGTPMAWMQADIVKDLGLEAFRTTHTDYQHDVMVNLEGFDTETMMWRKRTTFKAPTQSSWIHRVFVINADLILGTELRMDRLLIIRRNLRRAENEDLSEGQTDEDLPQMEDLSEGQTDGFAGTQSKISENRRDAIKHFI